MRFCVTAVTDRVVAAAYTQLIGDACCERLRRMESAKVLRRHFSLVKHMIAGAAGAGAALVLDIVRSGDQSAVYPVAAATTSLFKPFAVSPPPITLIWIAVLIVGCVATAVSRPSRLPAAFAGGFILMVGIAAVIAATASPG